ncbi:hypothetical protein NIES4073_59710 [Kalymmatonema gypsitolerans NIES-4073]|nr:hypothetical protein NIES4073_59710 [Scytonema sp. NIES-4073]
MKIRIVKNIYFPLVLVIIIHFAFGCQNTAPINAATLTKEYERSDENFSNPERGFFVAINPIRNQPVSPLEISEMQKLRSQKMTLVRRIYLLSEFKSRPISQSFLKMISNDCEIARKAGLKLIIRFAYNWQRGGDDAPQQIIFSHLEQLKPVFEANYDVIAYLEAGFIGSWGQWNRSPHGLDENPQARRETLFKLLSVLPGERMIAIPYAHHKRDAFNNHNPLTPQEAFNRTYRARTGVHNDCFLASIDDGGTYNSTNPDAVERQKKFLRLDNRYVVQGGEVCLPNEDDEKLDDCPNALTELARMRWSTLNSDSGGTEIYQDWKTQGCMEEIKRRLGYRFRLLKSVISRNIKPGGTFLMEFQIANDGWASPYNPRRLEVILRNRQTGNKYYLPVKNDPRMWMAGETKIVKIVGGIPPTMPLGEYQVLLNLPDPSPNLYNRPEYSIRLANQNVWEASTGYNSLLTSIVVDKNTAGSNYSGEQFFRLHN